MAASNLTPGNFPTKATLAIGCTLAILAGAHFYKDRSKGVDPSIFARVIQFQWPHRPRPVVAPTVIVKKQAPGSPSAISAYMIDDHLALDPFFAALWQLELKAAKPAAASDPVDVVTILHYGDSPTTADLITGDARAQLQQRFGDAGHGFNLIAKPWAWYGHRNVAISDGDWQSSQKDATGVGRYKQGSYGLGGAIFVGATGAHTTYTLSGAPQASVHVHYLAAPASGTFTVQAGDGTPVTINTAADAPSVAVTTVPIPPDTKRVTLRVTSGTVKTFGVDFRTDRSGILYDSLGLNGATTTVISRTFDPTLLAQSLHEVSPRLVIINYGTNESQFAGLIKTLDSELRTAVERIRTADPGVPILIMSPMDRGQRSGGDITTMATIPQIVAIQKQVAETTHCAFFDTYNAMGGEGTVGRWYGEQPRLMTADFIHPTPQGAAIVAKLLTDNLYAGYDRWKRAHAIAVAPSIPSTPKIVGNPAQPPSPVDRPSPAPATGPGPASGPAAKPAPVATPDPPPAEDAKPAPEAPAHPDTAGTIK